MSAFAAEALLFDMDGTLVDSTEAVLLAWRQLCERFDIDPNDVLPAVHGIPAAATIARFWPEQQRAEAVRWIEDAECTLLDGVVAIPGAREFTEQLESAGAAWAIVTSATPRLARARLGAAGLALPRVLVTADEVERGKPDPAPFLLGAERLGVAPERSIVIEDAPAGIRAGLAAGAQVVVRGPHGGDLARGLVQIDDYREVQLESVLPEIRGSWR